MGHPLSSTVPVFIITKMFYNNKALAQRSKLYQCLDMHSVFGSGHCNFWSFHGISGHYKKYCKHYQLYFLNKTKHFLLHCQR